MTKNRILENIDDPVWLEAHYQKHQKDFVDEFDQAFQDDNTSETLSVWHARLNYQAIVQVVDNYKMPIYILIGICLAAGFIAKVPAFFTIDGDWYYPRFIPVAVIGSVIAYFLTASASKQTKKFALIAFSLSVIYIAILPDDIKSASVIMALIHQPLFLLSILAFSFMSEGWRSVESRLSFIRYLGEVGIFSVLILLGGMVLTGITFALFSLIDLSIESWYMEYIVVLGVVSAPVVATYLYDAVQSRQSKFAIVLSNVFSPLFLVTILVYIIATIYQGKSPFSDREFLIIFNGLLVAILAITIFSIAGRTKSNANKIADIVNILLVTATIMVNIVALSAIVFRWSEYGMTVNRIVVTGANMLIFAHLAILLKHYVKLVLYRGDVAALEQAVTKYLPIYSLWTLCVMVILPVFAQYK
jgi:hypothetical protein